MQFSVSIRTILLVGFCGLTTIGIGLALYLGLAAAFQNTRELLSEDIEGLVDWMVDEVDGRLRPVEAQALEVAARVADGSIVLGTDVPGADIPERTDFFFRTVLAATPEAGAVALIARDGQMRGWARAGRGGPATALVEDWSSQPGAMEWVRAGADKDRAEWGPPVWVASLSSAAIVYEMPLHTSAGYFGYLVFTVPVSDLSRRLADIDDNAFILVGESDVLAHPRMLDWRPTKSAQTPSTNEIYTGGSALQPLAELGDPVLERIRNADDRNLVLVDETKDFGAVSVVVDDRQFVLIYRVITGFGPRPLTIGSYFDVETQADIITRLRTAGMAGAAVILTALILGLLVARVIARPIRVLARVAETVETGQFDAVGTLPSSRIKELGGALSSFEGMVAGLAERQVIRRTLGRYVPASVAEQLLRGGGGLKPVEAEATILFTDIAGFTTMTEALGPSRTVEVLNAFFSAMTEIIEDEGGVVTQFQGDAIMAIFNIPIAAADHAERACRAAIRMRAGSLHKRFAGEQLRCRIGINTGTVIAGAVGAEKRLSYTVYGDAVNLAARVEAMNKETNTDLLITEATAKQVETIALSRVGRLAVRGQSADVTVYTVDAEGAEGGEDAEGGAEGGEGV